MAYVIQLSYLVICFKINVKHTSCSLINISPLDNFDNAESVTKCLVKSLGRRKYLDLLFGDSCIYFQPHFMKETCLSDIASSIKRFTEELPATFGGYQNKWRHLDGKVIERLDYLSDLFDTPSLSCKPNMKRHVNLLTTAIQPEILGPVSRSKLIQLKRKSLQHEQPCYKHRQQHRQKGSISKQTKRLTYHSEKLNDSSNPLGRQISLAGNQYLDENSDRYEEAEELYKWSQCLPQL
ncbi:unnamed protein product [Trichobilharzia szidati]|nr:unnamed protein product [Trichobilharzia szidati]